MINRTKPFKLTPKEKAAISEYMKGIITQGEAAKRLRLRERNYVYRVTDALMRHMVRTGKLDIDALLNND